MLHRFIFSYLRPLGIEYTHCSTLNVVHSGRSSVLFCCCGILRHHDAVS